MLPRLSLSVFLSLSVSVLALTSAARAADGYLIDAGQGARNLQAPVNGLQAPANVSPMLGEANSNATPARPAASGGVPVGLRLGIVGADGTPPDESALRYYASMNQRARVSIEIDRLRRLYPGWEPPQNLYDTAAPGGEDEGSLWDLFTTDRLDELKAAIDRRMKDESGWQPSADLLQKMQRKALRLRILGLYRDGRMKDVLDLVKNEGFGGDDADVDVLWTVAEVYAKSKQVADAQAIYRAILSSSNDSSQRLATIQKAMGVLRMSDVEPLIAMGRPGPDGRNEFAAILIDIVRARISAYLHDERPDEVDGGELQAFEEYARAATDPNQTALVAWYFYKLKDHRNAFEWFKSALERGGDAMIAHGLAHSLRELGMKRETEEVAYAWRDPLVNNVIVFLDILEADLTKEIPPFIEPERLNRYARVTMETASGEGAQALAWYAFNSCQYDVAWEWFQRATSWFPKEATVYGYALTANKLKKKKELLELVNRYDGLFPKVVEILFPDGYYHPPTPCDSPEVLKNRPRPQPMGAFTVPGPANIDPAMARAGADTRDAATQYGLNPQGQPQEQPQLPKISRADFPVATDPENPQRAQPIPRVGDRNVQASFQPSVNVGLMAEPSRGPYPLVARRVPGVGPMPYERWGFSLLPGWNGIETATWPPASAQVAPAGTLWATESVAKVDPVVPSGGPRAPGALPTYAPQNQSFVPATSSVLPQQMQPRYAPQPMGGAPMPQPAWGGSRSELRTIDRRSALGGGKLYAALVDLDPVGSIAPEPIGPAMKFEPLDTSGSGWGLRAALDPQLLRAEAQASYHARDYAKTLAQLDAHAALAPESLDLKMIRGWSLLHLDRRDEARRVFASLPVKPKGIGRGALAVSPTLTLRR